MTSQSAPSVPVNAIPSPEHGPLSGVMCCPRCRADLDFRSDEVVCAGKQCPYARNGFPKASGQPVLIDFEHSIFDRAAYADDRGSVITRDDTGKSFSVRLRRLLTGGNPVAYAKAQQLVKQLASCEQTSRILIIGGGAIGAGAEPLYQTDRVRLVGSDVYASPNTHVVADGHSLPFRDGVFDAVWIQAVLEHVLDPATVVDEIHRVLKPNGLVYADTPFIQQVHEAAYDFTRFTLSGHRWLFRRFDEIDAGPVGGAGRALVWSIKYFLLSLGLSSRLATAATFPFFWVRLLDRIARPDVKADAACGVYFYGRRSETSLRPSEMPRYYRTKRLSPSG